MLTFDRHVASLGAMLVILSLAFNAFTQQVLTAETRSVGSQISEADLATGFVVPRSTSYTNVVEPEALDAGQFYCKPKGRLFVRLLTLYRP